METPLGNVSRSFDYSDGVTGKPYLTDYGRVADHSLRNSSLASHNGDSRILTLMAARTYYIGHILSL
jgi:hypothetical protein